MQRLILSLFFFCACGDDATTDAAVRSDAATDTVGTDTLADTARTDAGPIEDANEPADVPSVDAGPPPPVRRDGDRFVVRDEDGNEHTLCGCDSDTLALGLGPSLSIVVDQPVRVYFDNLIAGDATEHSWTTYSAGALGETRDDHWTLTSAEVLSDELFVIAWNAAGIPIGIGATMLSVSATNAGTGTNPTILFLGDSTTAGGIYARAMLDIFDEDAMDATTVGTVVTGRASHEGRSGWKISDYFDDRRGGGENPFFNAATGGFDYRYYLSSNGMEAPDYFFVHLGINDVFTGSDESIPERIDVMLERLDGFFMNILSVAPDTELAIGLTIMPCATESGFTENYMGQYTRAGYKPRIAMWARRIIAHYRGGDVHLVPLNATIDTVNGFPNVPEGEGIRHTNAVHPNGMGYGQMGETIYHWLKAQ